MHLQNCRTLKKSEDRSGENWSRATGIFEQIQVPVESRVPRDLTFASPFPTSGRGQVSGFMVGCHTQGR